MHMYVFYRTETWPLTSEQVVSGSEFTTWTVVENEWNSRSLTSDVTEDRQAVRMSAVVFPFDCERRGEWGRGYWRGWGGCKKSWVCGRNFIDSCDCSPHPGSPHSALCRRWCEGLWRVRWWQSPLPPSYSYEGGQSGRVTKFPVISLHSLSLQNVWSNLWIGQPPRVGSPGRCVKCC